LAPSPTVAAIPDFGAIRQCTARLVESLRRHKEAETKLLLETLNTDIGVGD
jgi:hypothetical protein